MGVGSTNSQGWPVVDLFCGVGGLTHGFIRERGFKVLAGFDSDPSCKFAYECNNRAPFVHKKIEETTSDEISEKFGDSPVKILVGCAPCQPFSLYTVKQEKDDKWKLLLQFRRLIDEVEPEIVSMENVPELVKHSVFKEFVEALKSLGYHVSFEIVFCPDYGVPQSRKRLVLVASKLGPIDLIGKTHRRSRWRTVRKAKGRLDRLSAGSRSKSDRLHRARALNCMNLERIKHTPAGGSWKDWPDRLRLTCHKKTSGETYRSIYGRMKWDEPAPTLTTHCTGIGNGRYGHPNQDRAISLREAALLQSFPRRYKFVAPRKKVINKIVSRQIGNAVPVRLGQIIARSIKRHLEEVMVREKKGSSHARATKHADVSHQNQGHRSRAAR